MRVLRGRNNYEQPWFDLWWCLQTAKKLCEDLQFFRISRDFLTVNTYFLTWIPDIRKWGRLKKSIKKKSFFYFCSPTISQQAVLFRKAIRPLPASLSSREKSLCRSVILTGFFDCKYPLFWDEYRYIKVGDLKKSIKKKFFFFTFFLEVSPNLAHVSAWPYDQQGNV